jgi:hypothetical protein
VSSKPSKCAELNIVVVFGLYDSTVDSYFFAKQRQEVGEIASSPLAIMKTCTKSSLLFLMALLEKQQVKRPNARELQFEMGLSS